MQVGFFSMGSAALPKKPGHPSPARIPYVRVLVQNKKAARAQQGLSVYYQKPRHLASFPPLNSPSAESTRHKCRKRKNRKSRAAYPSHLSQPIGGQRKGGQRLGVLNFPVCYLFPHFGERDFDDVQKFIRVQML